MKCELIKFLGVFCSCFFTLFAWQQVEGTTIDHSSPYVYGANIGWVNAVANTNNGMSLGYSYCTGYLYSANCGWISLGHGPTNGWQYGNASASDWGVNHDGEGRLTGHAYGANIGWLTFEQTHGQPKVDLKTGILSGYIWSANAGWLSLSNVQAYVRTESLDSGPDSDADGIADAWEYAEVGGLGILSDGDHDEDADGVSDVDEYLADTNPQDPADYLMITNFIQNGGTSTFSWRSRPTRQYHLETTNSLADVAGAWSNVFAAPLGPDQGNSMGTSVFLGGNAPSRFYRVKAIKPLAP